MRGRWWIAGLGAALLSAAWLVRHRERVRPASSAAPPDEVAVPTIARVEPAAPAPLDGLELAHVSYAGRTATARTAAGATAELTLDADLQRTAEALMAARRLPEAAVVLMDVETGRLLVYASHVEGRPPRDLCAEASAPSASVFKIVTAAALIEDARVGPDTTQCYSGGEQRIVAADLVEDPKRDHWCTTLAGALGRSVNAVFARLAHERLTRDQLDEMARRFGYGEPFAFDVPVEISTLRVPDDALGLARTAAGFWNTTLSPLEAAEISAIVARGGESVRPRLVDEVVGASGQILWSAPPPPTPERVVARTTADDLAAMMRRTITEGTSRRAFHDPRGAAFLPGIAVAGKTGTLSDAAAHRYFTWFTGFAPSRASGGPPPVAVAVLVVNGPVWQVKANVVARDVLRAYFASRGAPGVTAPPRAEAALRRSRRSASATSKERAARGEP